ncbi:hypothetical protein GCM10027051_08440 [Niabella terrae]
MDSEKNIHIDELCRHYRIETSFIQSLDDCGLIRLTKTEESLFISDDQLSAVEKFMHFHYDLDINLPGIEAISHLLGRIEQLQQQLRELED